MDGAIKLGSCMKCGKPVYIESVHGSPTNGNVLIQSCDKGGDCEVDILLTPFAIRSRWY